MFENLPIELKIQYEPKINPDGKLLNGIKPINKKKYWQYDFDLDCDNFFECLNNPFSDLYDSGIANKNNKYIFRGHSNYEWDLIPSVFRDFNLDENKNKLNILKSGNGHFLNELKDFLNFIKGINSLGYKIDNESFKLINNVLIDDDLKTFDLNKDFPRETQLKELALAQHYGVQTRLLDFTINPNKAIFFACEKIKHPKTDDDSKIGIWVIPERLIDISKEDFYIERVFVQGYQNKNMVAQEGMFINYFYGRILDDNLFNPNGKIKTLDEYLYDCKRNEDNSKLIKQKIGKPMLLTLSHKVVWQAVKKLELMNINWSTIQPDLDGVRKEVERKRIHKL